MTESLSAPVSGLRLFDKTSDATKAEETKRARVCTTDQGSDSLLTEAKWRGRAAFYQTANRWRQAEVELVPKHQPRTR